ncbi:MAG: hypothetical protein KH117_13955, partial [Dysgonomonas sp.]|uniref:helix-turn-helix domain-containing protein n=1 Tax=Dysgonomonas sp. TaxID=1891233 RepID=UPI002579C907
IQSFITCALTFYLTGGILFNYFSGLLFNYIIHPTLQTGVSSNTVSKGALFNVLERVEKQMLIDTLILMQGNITKSAEQLGITRRIMGLLVNKHQIDIKKFKHLSHENN